LIEGWKEKPKKLQQNAKERIFKKKWGVKWKKNIWEIAIEWVNWKKKLL